MGKTVNKATNILVILPIISSFVLWIVGIDTPITQFLYVNFLYFLLGIILLFLILKLKELDRTDIMIICFSLGLFLFYTLTSPVRHSNRFINADLPIIILFLLCFKKANFTKSDGWIMVVVSGFSLFGILFRLFVELPKLIDPALLWQKANKLEFIWINTNTIGAAILFSVIIVTVLIKSFDIGYFKLLVIPIYIAGIIGTWVCQSSASFISLVVFVLLDNLVPKKILQKKWLLICGFTLLFLLAPFVFYHFARSTGVDFFTGRERIWGEFFDKWLSSHQNMAIGMAPFTASWKPLGTHNSFLYILGNYGIVGYIFFFGFILTLLVKSALGRKKYSKTQISLLIGFAVIFLHSFMEDIIVEYYWLPIVYSVLGLFLQDESYFAHNEEVSNRKSKHKKPLFMRHN